ncbi:MAG: substrate-binding domain-containing protein [Cardiobacteriaceae bacterium]|nr:substrate-binding domain-containing protein [Cardiobacteriaceae bacterium]
MKTPISWKSKSLTSLGIALSALWLVACGSEEKSAEESVVSRHKIGISIARNDDNSPFLQQVYQTFQQRSSLFPNLEIMIGSAGNDQAKQYEQLDQFLAQGAQLLIINLADLNKGTELTQRYCAKVPLVFYNFHPGINALSSCSKAYFVDAEVVSAAVTQGVEMLKSWKDNPEWDKNGDGVIQLALLGAIQFDPNASARSDWVVTTVKNYPEIKADAEVVFREDAFFQTHLAHDVVEKWVQDAKFDQVEVIASASDSMAFGALEVLTKHQKKVPIFSMDGLKPAQEAIQRGEIVYSARADFNNEIDTALQLATNLVTGQPAHQGLKYLLNNQEVRIPYIFSK